MRILNIFFIVLFILSACLQYNDPDPYLWVPLYLYAAFLCYLALLKTYKAVFYFTGLGVYVAYAIYLFFDKAGVLTWVSEHHAENITQSMKAKKPWIEATREFFGLLIVTVALLINMIYLKKYHQKK